MCSGSFCTSYRSSNRHLSLETQWGGASPVEPCLSCVGWDRDAGGLRGRVGNSAWRPRRRKRRNALKSCWSHWLLVPRWLLAGKHQSQTSNVEQRGVWGFCSTHPSGKTKFVLSPHQPWVSWQALGFRCITERKVEPKLGNSSEILKFSEVKCLLSLHLSSRSCLLLAVFGPELPPLPATHFAQSGASNSSPGKRPDIGNGKNTMDLDCRAPKDSLPSSHNTRA